MAGSLCCNKFSLFLLVSGTGYFLLCSDYAIGQSKLNSDSVQVRSLEKVIITARKNRSENSSATPMQVLKGDELERINSLSVADAIRYFSGVQLKDYGGVGGLKTINVRSLGSNHAGVFYDGIELGNAQNGQVDLGKYSLDNIEAIELYSGQKSTIFQSAKAFASGNSLYINSKTTSFKNGERSNEKISFKSGSFALIDPSLLWQYKISKNTSSSLSAEFIHSSGQYKFRYTNGVYDTTAVRHNGDINAFRIETGFNGTLKDSSEWTAKFYVYQSERGLPGAIVSNKFDYTQRQWDKNIFIQSSYKKNIGERSSLISGLKYANDFTRYLDPEFVTTTGFLNNRYSQQELYGTVSLKYKLTNFWDFALSQDYQWNKLDANIYHFAYPTRYTFLSAIASEIHLPRLNIQGSLLGTFVKDKVEAFDAAAKKNELSPGILISWQPFASDDFHVRGFYKKVFRLPTFNDLYYTFIGNTLLKPEYTWQYNAGITYGKFIRSHWFKFFNAQADVYYNQVKNKIVAIPGANLFRWTMYNLGKVAITGVEINAQLSGQITDVFQFHTAISYTYQQALDITGGDNYRSQIPYTPLNSGSVTGGVDHRKLSLNYSFIYTGQRYSQKANIPENYLQPWYTHDISVGWKSEYQSKIIKLNLEINNVFNQYYDVINNFPMPGRSVRVNISCQL